MILLSVMLNCAIDYHFYDRTSTGHAKFLWNSTACCVTISAAAGGPAEGGTMRKIWCVDKKILTALLALALLAGLLPGAAFAEEEGSVTDYAAGSAGIAVIDPAAVETRIENYLEENGLNKDTISVGYCYLDTGETWFYHPDLWYYSASLYKVPLCMLINDRENAGEFSEDSRLEGMELAYLKENVLVYSNNDMAYTLIRALGGDTAGSKCSEMTIAYTDLPEDYFAESFFLSSYYSVRYFTQILRTLYTHSDDYADLIEYLKQAEPDTYYHVTLGDTYEIAQKYGALDRTYTDADYTHAGAVIYTPHPFAVVVMTKDYPYAYQQYIADIGQLLAEYTLSCDEAYEAQLTAAETAEETAAAENTVRAEEETPLPTEPAAEAEAIGTTAETQPLSTPNAEGGNTSEAGQKLRLIPMTACLLLILILTAAAIARGGSKKKKHKKRRR